MTTIAIDPHLNGLADAAQGGIASGIFAQLLGGTARVRLLARVPLGVDLDVQRDEIGATITHDESAIARVEAAAPHRREIPIVPTFADALDALQRHPLRGIRHPFSDCIVCSPHRPDGLRVVFASSRRRDDVLIAPLQARQQLVVDGALRPEALWGALDCTSFPADLLHSRTLAVTGQLTAHVERAVAADERLVVVGWQVDKGSRSHRTASAVLDEAGRVVAFADAVWVEVAEQTIERAGADDHPARIHVR